MGEVVTTQWGRLEGERDGRVCVFRGIPYARAPVDDLRFRPPEPPVPWSGRVRPATRFGPSAPQAPQAMLLIRRLIGVAQDHQSQDCLYLNVWTPRPDGRRRPVMVWIHGGAFLMGSGSTALYWGARLAERGDVVVVTINYRLGALGFLNHPHLAESEDGVAGNLGLRDQIAALEWVRDEIEAFGGDPENVTIFGESAGGMSVGTLLGTPRARGLFHRAILQSGAAENVSSRERAMAVAEAFLSRLGASADDPGALRRARVSQILRAQRDTSVEFGIGLGFLPWQPAVDGDLLPEPPIDAIARGNAASVPVLVGTNRDEWKLFMLGDPRGLRLDEAGLRRRVERVLSEREPAVRADVDEAIATYREGERAGVSPSGLWEAFQSDRVFHQPAQRLAALQSGHAGGAFRYLFTWSPPVAGRAMGACHGLEIPFVFGTLLNRYLRPLVGLTRQSRSLSVCMQDAWIAFARSGEPGHEGLPDWPRYRPEPRPTMFLGRECEARPAPFAAECAYWANARAG